MSPAFRVSKRSIRELLVSGQVVLYVINALHFKAPWADAFDFRRTHPDTFTLATGSTAICDMMSREGYFWCVEDEAFQAVDLPYAFGAFRMTVLLPRPHFKIDAFLAHFDEPSWLRCLAALAQREGSLSMPKFRIEFPLGLNEVLQAMGVRLAFDPFRADLTGISDPADGNRLYVTEVKHKAFVNVDEDGTEAAAATSVEGSRMGMSTNRFVMRVDHPFVFVIREAVSGTILFMGKVVSP